MKAATRKTTGHRVTLTPREYRAWRDYSRLTAKSQRLVRELPHALAIAEGVVPLPRQRATR